MLIGGDPAITAPPQLTHDRPQYYDAILHGTPVRTVAAWMPLDSNNGASGEVLVLVAETLHGRQRLALEILASVVVPQLLLIVMASAAVYFGVSRGLLPLKRLQGRGACLPLPPRPEPDRYPRRARRGEAAGGRGQRIAAAPGKTNLQQPVHRPRGPPAQIPLRLKAQIELALRENDPARVRHSLAQLYVGVLPVASGTPTPSLARTSPVPSIPSTCRRST